MIYEWNLLRTIACLSIVLLHSTTQISRQTGMPDLELYSILRIFLCFATPTFVILSEIILANKYKEKIPHGFFKTRIKYILIPFICFAFIDASVSYNYQFDAALFGKFYRNLLGNYMGYFILIILQFYLLHYIVVKFKINMFLFTPFSFIIMVIHLYILNFSDSSFIIENQNYLKLPFTAWLGYFSIAYLIGANYNSVLKYLSKYKWYILCGVILSVVLLYFSYELGYRRTNSRRVDLFPLVITFSMLILYIGSRLRSNRIVNMISNYSFGIYLLHWQIQKIIAPHIAGWFSDYFPRVLVLFIFSVIISMIIVRVFNLIPFGKYIVGKIRVNPDKKLSNKLLVQKT